MKKILFYSKKCKHSLNLLNLLKETGDLDDIKIVCFEDDKFPVQINKVPTYITSELNHPLVGKDIFKFFDILEYFGKPTNNIKFWKEKIIKRPKIDNFIKGKEHQVNYDTLKNNLSRNNELKQRNELNKLIEERRRQIN